MNTFLEEKTLILVQQAIPVQNREDKHRFLWHTSYICGGGIAVRLKSTRPNRNVHAAKIVILSLGCRLNLCIVLNFKAEHHTQKLFIVDCDDAVLICVVLSE
jgi:hypothetical protein